MRVGQLWIDVLTFDEALGKIERLVEAGEGGSVFTPNVDHVVNGESNPAFREAYAGASLSLADGQPLLWASRLLGTPLPERIAGADLVLPLIGRAASRGWSVYLLGGGPGVGETAGARLVRATGVQIAGVDAPIFPLGPGDSERVIERVRAASPQLILVALGSPKQELWIHQAAKCIRPAVAIGVGAALDFIAGRIRRAPVWVRRAGLEWLFRVVQEPRRLARRYLVNDPRFLLVVYRMLRELRRERVRLRDQ